MEKTKKKLSLQTIKDVYQDMKTDTQFANDRKRWSSNIKKFIIGLFKFLILVKFLDLLTMLTTSAFQLLMI